MHLLYNICVYCYVRLKITFGVLFGCYDNLLSAQPIPKPNTPNSNTFEFAIPFCAVSIMKNKTRHLENAILRSIWFFVYRHVFACINILYRSCFRPGYYSKKMPLYIKISNGTFKKFNEFKASRTKFNPFSNIWFIQNVCMGILLKSFTTYTDDDYYEMFRIRDECKIKYERMIVQHQKITDIINKYDNYMKTKFPW